MVYLPTFTIHINYIKCRSTYPWILWDVLGTMTYSFSTLPGPLDPVPSDVSEHRAAKEMCGRAKKARAEGLRIYMCQGLNSHSLFPYNRG